MRAKGIKVLAIQLNPKDPNSWYVMEEKRALEENRGQMIVIAFHNKRFFSNFPCFIALTSLLQAAPFAKMSIVSIISGAAAKASGGDFIQGALSAMVVWLYNDLKKAIKEFNKGKILPNSVGLGRALEKFFGGWSRDYSFGPLHPVTQSLKHDPTLINAIKEYRRDFYLQNGRWPTKGDFGRLRTGMFSL